MAAGCSSPPPPSTDSLAGDYERRHQVFSFHGNEVVAVEVTDTVRIACAVPDDAESTIAGRLTGVDGANCRLAGTVGWDAGSYIARLIPEEDRQSPACALELTLAGESLRLAPADRAGNCTQIPCAESGMQPVVLSRVREVDCRSGLESALESGPG